MEHSAGRESLLSGAGDLALVRGDVVERHIPSVDTDLGKRSHDPLIEKRVGLLETQTLDQGRRYCQRVRDAVARFHEHRAATGDSAHHPDAVPRSRLGVDLVTHGLERSDHDQGRVPVPETQCRRTLTRCDLTRDDLVQRDVHRGIENHRRDEVEGVDPPSSWRGRVRAGSRCRPTAA